MRNASLFFVVNLLIEVHPPFQAEKRVFTMGDPFSLVC